MFLLVSLVRKGIGRQGLGATMHTAHAMGEPLPRAVEFRDTDSFTTLEMKELILNMTSYRPSRRPSSSDVHQNVATMCEYVSEVETIKNSTCKLFSDLSVLISVMSQDCQDHSGSVNGFEGTFVTFVYIRINSHGSGLLRALLLKVKR